MDEERRTPVGRGEKVRRAVLAATLIELADRGYTGLSVDEVARRAGVNKTTVYRRWGDRRSLVADAIAAAMADEPAPDTGGVEGDLRAWALALVRTLTSPAGRAVAHTLLTPGDPEIAGAKHRFFDERLRRAEPMVDRAVQRGELPPGTSAAALLRTLIAPIYLRLLVTAEPLDEDAAEQAARVALAAAAAGVLTVRSGPDPAG